MGNITLMIAKVRIKPRITYELVSPHQDVMIRPWNFSNIVGNITLMIAKVRIKPIYKGGALHHTALETPLQNIIHHISKVDNAHQLQFKR